VDEPHEFEGADLEEALSHASASLRIPVDNLRYEVLQEGRRSFLGVGRRPVRIRVRPQEGVSTSEPETSRATVTSERESPGSETGAIRSFLSEFLSSSPFELEFRIVEDEERIQIDLDGPDRDLLLDRKGEAIGALQVVLGRVVTRHGSGKILEVDCGDFRRHLQDEMVDIAILTAQKVKRLGEPQSLRPMNPYERRLIHLALKDDPEVETRSDGDGFLKKVTILPRRGSGSGGPASQ